MPDTTLLDKIIVEGKLARDDSQKEFARDLVAEFVNSVLAEEGGTVGNDVVALINDKIAEIDDLLSAQLNEILHDPDLQKLEATWRGLSFLVFNTETSTSLKLRILNITKEELLKDLEKAVEFDQSALFKKVYEEEYGTFGGNPYSMLMGDYEFGRHPNDVKLLELVSNVAAAAHAPFISAASPRLFDMDSFTELGVPRDLSKIFESMELVKWRSFRNSEDSRYVSLVLPHVLLRLPYGPDTKPVEGVNFVEDTDGRDHKKYLWGNAAYVLTQRVTDAFAKHGWTAAIRGVEGGGKVEGLPAHTFRTDEGDVALKCPTEIAITDRRENELSKSGLLPLIHRKNTDKAAFIGAQSLYRPKKYDKEEATAADNLSARIPYMFAISRFSHYLKCMVRDQIGETKERDELEGWLQSWINQYVDADPANSTIQTKARKPLAAARVDVFEDAENPGFYGARFYLRPHFQLEGMDIGMSLVSRLPAKAG